jgi:hypothetical protein
MADQKFIGRPSKGVATAVSITMAAGTWYSLLGSISAWAGDSEVDVAEEIGRQLHEAVFGEEEL